jgi:hypothetical protein
MNQLKVEILVKRVRDLAAKKDEYKQEIGETYSSSRRMTMQKAQFETINDDLGEQLDKYGINRPDENLRD